MRGRISFSFFLGPFVTMCATESTKSDYVRYIMLVNAHLEYSPSACGYSTFPVL